MNLLICIHNSNIQHFLYSLSYTIYYIIIYLILLFRGPKLIVFTRLCSLFQTVNCLCVCLWNLMRCFWICGGRVDGGYVSEYIGKSSVDGNMFVSEEDNGLNYWFESVFLVILKQGVRKNIFINIPILVRSHVIILIFCKKK